MRKIIKNNRFTLVELLMAMAVFTVIALIMMRFFNSAQQIWSKTSQRNELYSNARIALDLMARDLQCALYKNDNSEQGIYPFWFQKINDLNAINANYYPADRFGPNPNILPHAWTGLNFISPTNVRPTGVKSSICKIRYTFIPSGTDNTPEKWLANGNGGKIYDNTNDEDDSGWQGWLVRSCTGDRDNTGKINPKYNFSNLPIPAFRPAGLGVTAGDKWRMNAIWIQNASYTVATNDLLPSAANSSFSEWEKVIPHVVELFFECYYYDATGTMQKFDAMPPLDATGADTNTPSATPILDRLTYGTEFPVMMNIQLSLLSNTDWREWRRAVKRGDTGNANLILSKKLRTFSKVVFLNKRESN